MDDETVTDLLRFFAALSDEERLRIAGRLAGGAANAGTLAAELGLKPAAVARHLSALGEAGIACVERGDGEQRWSLDIERLRARRKLLLGRERAPSPADEPGTPGWERAVLTAFFDGERLKEIPANLKKRMVILGWLAGRFEPGARYPEREVNEIIKRHHPDSAALRRELIDRGLMARERGYYWRLPDTGAQG